MARLDDNYIQQPTDAEGYIVAARGMLDGALPLKDVEPIPVFALTLLCGHATEAALKAMLAQVGVPTSELSGHTLGHKLLRLWERAETERVSLPSPRPPWVEHLDRVYASPHHLRYPLGFHAIVLPNQLDMLNGTKNLVEIATAMAA